MELINVITFLVIYNKFVTQSLAENDIYNCQMDFFSCFVKYFVPQKSCTVFLGPVNISTIDKLSDSLVFATAIDEPIKNSTIFYNRYVSIPKLSVQSNFTEVIQSLFYNSKIKTNALQRTR
jgi:hypothetical protein